MKYLETEHEVVNDIILDTESGPDLNDSFLSVSSTTSSSINLHTATSTGNV